MVALGAQRAANVQSDVMRNALPALCLVVFAVAAGINVRQTEPLIVKRQQDRTALSAIDSVLRLTPPNAIVVADWNFATPLAYAAYVEHRFGRRLILGHNDPAIVVGLARKRDVFFLPYPEDAMRVPDACVEWLPTSDPPLYRVHPLAAEHRFEADDAGICAPTQTP